MSTSCVFHSYKKSQKSPNHRKMKVDPVHFMFKHVNEKSTGCGYKQNCTILGNSFQTYTHPVLLSLTCLNMKQTGTTYDKWILCVSLRHYLWIKHTESTYKTAKIHQNISGSCMFLVHNDVSSGHNPSIIYYGKYW